MEEVKVRLSHIPCPWLMIFDNADDASVVLPYLPYGGDTNNARHVIVTTRKLADTWHNEVIWYFFSQSKDLFSHNLSIHGM